MSDEKDSQSTRDRNSAILTQIRVKGFAKISELQELLGGVSHMTIRRSLNELAEEGLIKRVHGGATIPDPWEKEIAFQNRIAKNLEIKLSLAQHVQPMIPEGGSVYLDGGTTCFEIAKQLWIAEKKCTVITDSLAIVRELLGKQSIEAILLGGKLSDDGNTMDGLVTLETASRMSVDLAIFSCDSFNDDELQIHMFTGSRTKKSMMQRSESSMCVSASDKYGKARCFHFCGWKEIDTFITDSGLPESARDRIASHGVALRIVPIPRESISN